jgi:hypothetical protein
MATQEKYVKINKDEIKDLYGNAIVRNFIIKHKGSIYIYHLKKQWLWQWCRKG